MNKRRHIQNSRAGSKRTNGIVTAIVIILSLALIAGIIVLSPLGKILLDKVIIPITACFSEPKEDKAIVSALQQQDEKIDAATPSPKPTEKAREVISIEETPFYILQMGAFTDETTARTHADDIRRLGAAGVVYAEGSVYRVFAAAYTDENSLMKVQAQVRNDGFEATPYIVEKRALKITADGDASAVSTIRDAAKLMSDVRACL